MFERDLSQHRDHGEMPWASSIEDLAYPLPACGQCEASGHTPGGEHGGITGSIPKFQGGSGPNELHPL